MWKFSYIIAAPAWPKKFHGNPLASSSTQSLFTCPWYYQVHFSPRQLVGTSMGCASHLVFLSPESLTPEQVCTPAHLIPSPHLLHVPVWLQTAGYWFYRLPQTSGLMWLLSCGVILLLPLIWMLCPTPCYFWLFCLTVALQVWLTLHVDIL